MNRYAACALLACLLFACELDAGVILQDQSTGTHQIQAYSPTGQTITADDSYLKSIGFYFREMNDRLPNGPVSVILRQGAGVDGNEIARQSLDIAPGTWGYVDFLFPAVELVIGESYTAIVEATNERWRLQRNFHLYGDIGNPPIPGRVDYSGGHMLLLGELMVVGDLKFRIVTVPEPTALLLATLLALCSLSREKRV